MRERTRSARRTSATRSTSSAATASARTTSSAIRTASARRLGLRGDAGRPRRAPVRWRGDGHPSDATATPTPTATHPLDPGADRRPLLGEQRLPDHLLRQRRVLRGRDPATRTSTARTVGSGQCEAERHADDDADADAPADDRADESLPPEPLPERPEVHRQHRRWTGLRRHQLEQRLLDHRHRWLRQPVGGRGDAVPPGSAAGCR